MKSQQIRQFDMLRRIQQFLEAFAAKLGGVNASTARQDLDQLVQEMGANESAQATSTLSAKSETATLESLRRDLWNHHMKPVAAIAAARLRDVPGFKALQMPSADVKVAVLVSDANAMAEAAREHNDVFVQGGRPANFADALVAAAAAVRASIDARGKTISAKAGARDGLKASSSRTHLVVKMLDTQVKSGLVDDAKALAAWKSAKRIGRGKVVPIEATIPAATPGGTVTTPATSTTVATATQVPAPKAA